MDTLGSVKKCLIDSLSVLSEVRAVTALPPVALPELLQHCGWDPGKLEWAHTVLSMLASAYVWGDSAVSESVIALTVATQVRR